MECIILAGGLGTRLRGVIGEQPKCMAPVNGQPFLAYLFRYLQQQRVQRVVLSLGYKHEAITGWYRQQDWPFDIDYVVEEEPLGTGGGIRLALEACRERNVAVLNGDTMFQVPLADMLLIHAATNAETTLALKPMRQFERYGAVRIDPEYRITGFEEKQYVEEGLINGGIYFINRPAFLSKDRPAKFSFEKDYLEPGAGSGSLYGFVSDSYFIDIGIPADYEQAGVDFKLLYP